MPRTSIDPGPTVMAPKYTSYERRSPGTNGRETGVVVVPVAVCSCASDATLIATSPIAIRLVYCSFVIAPLSCHHVLSSYPQCCGRLRLSSGPVSGIDHDLAVNDRHEA